LNSRAVYIIGGAGAGKSTFTGSLVEAMGLTYGPLEALHSLQNAKALVTLRGHGLFDGVGEALGLYLGVHRESFPGTDGLDRASSPVGKDWLELWSSAGQLPSFILSEGATLATRPFLTALNQHTDLLLVHLHAHDEIIEERFRKRGSNQDARFVLNTITRSRNLLDHMQKLDAWTMSVDTGDDEAWAMATDICLDHLVGNYRHEGQRRWL